MSDSDSDSDLIRRPQEMSNANKLEGDLLSSVNNLFLSFVLVIEDKDGSGNKLEQTACFCVT